MSTQAQKLGTILIVDDEVVTFYEEIAKELYETYEVTTYTSKQEVVVQPEVFNPKLALVDLNLNHQHDGFEVIDYLNKVYPNLPVIVVTKEDIGRTVLEAQRRGNVKDVLIKGVYDKAEWIKKIEQTLVDYPTVPLATLYLTYHAKDAHLARLVLEGINRKGKCKVIDGNTSEIASGKVNLILALLSNNVQKEAQNNVIHTINWGVDNKKTIKGAWISTYNRDTKNTPSACSGNNMVANFQNCLKLLGGNKMSLLESSLNPHRVIKEVISITTAFEYEIDKILKAYQL